VAVVIRTHVVAAAVIFAETAKIKFHFALNVALQMAVSVLIADLF